MSVDSKVIERFFRVLLEEIQAEAPRYLRESFTVAEIYQSLVPYRTHRDRIGVEINGDYEDALLRLLAGEGGFLNLESDAARERVRRELKHANPNTGLFREFAAVEVSVNRNRIPAELDFPKPALGGSDRSGEGAAASAPTGGESGDGGGEAGLQTSPGTAKSEARAAERTSKGAHSPSREPKSESREDVAPGSSPKGDLGSAFQSPTTPKPGAMRPGAPSRSNSDLPPESCPECAEELPERDTLRFCPFCGANVFVVPCGKCGEVLERNWRFCVSCGTSAGS